MRQAAGLSSRLERSKSFEMLVSPVGLAIFSLVFFLFSCAIPPGIYSRIIGEQDLMFFDPLTIFFYITCVVSFVLGAWASALAALPLRSTIIIKAKFSATAFLLIPLVVGTAFALLSCVLLMRNNPNLLILIAAQQGGALKTESGLSTEGTLSFAPMVLVAFIWWAFWRSHDLQLKKRARLLVNCALFIASFTVLISATLTLGRLIIMVLISGLAILYFLRRPAGASIGRTSMIGVAAGVCVILMFIIFGLLRGAQWDEQLYMLLGYTSASYNRLAAVVHGVMRYPFAGRGLYLSYGIAFSHKINAILPMNQAFRWPDQIDVWGSEFSAVSQAGLDSTMIWAGTFGYIYSDLGWFSGVYLFGYGLLYGLVWTLMQRGRIAGVVLYPFFGFCVLYWFGANYLLDSTVMILATSAAVLAIYERLAAQSC